MRKKETSPIAHCDKEFFESFYDRNKRFIFYIAGKYAAVVEEREDLVQDTVERLLSNVSSLKGLNEQKGKKYIALTVRTAYIDNEKKKGDSPAQSGAILETLVRAGIVSSEDAHRHSAWLDVEQLRKELPPRDWFVLEGKYLLGYTQEQLANQIGVSTDSIRMIICRAKEKARLILHPEFDTEDDDHE